MKFKTVAIIMALGLLVVMGTAAAWSPFGNIDLQGRYNITDINEILLNVSFDSAAMFWDSSADKLTVTNIAPANLESNMDGTGYNITSAWSTITNLVATNLESNIDGTGYTLTIGDLIGAADVNSTDIFVTNLYATNLEKDLDATGYSITASTELASALGDFGNLEADNLESNMDGTGYNITAAYYFGDGSELSGTGNSSWTEALANTLYCKLTGCTMTGAITGTSAEFTGNVEVQGNATIGDSSETLACEMYDNTTYFMHDCTRDVFFDESVYTDNIIVGAAAEACSATIAGAIGYNSTTFYGCNSTDWVAFT